MSLINDVVSITPSHEVVLVLDDVDVEVNVPGLWATGSGTLGSWIVGTGIDCASCGASAPALACGSDSESVDGSSGASSKFSISSQDLSGPISKDKEDHIAHF